MADLFSVTAPLAIRYPDGERQIMVERIAYSDGLLYLPVFWTDHGVEQSMRFVGGPVKGDGPWKVGEAVVTVLACHGTDAVLANDFSRWQERLSLIGEDYPPSEDIRQMMKTHAASVAGSGNCHPRFSPD